MACLELFKLKIDLCSLATPERMQIKNLVRDASTSGSRHIFLKKSFQDNILFADFLTIYRGPAFHNIDVRSAGHTLKEISNHKAKGCA